MKLAVLALLLLTTIILTAATTLTQWRMNDQVVAQEIDWDSHLTLAIAQAPDTDDPEEPGKPMRCDNYLGTPADMKCHCARDKQNCNGGIPQGPVNVEMDRACLTYCKMQHCECRGHGCRS